MGGAGEDMAKKSLRRGRRRRSRPHLFERSSPKNFSPLNRNKPRLIRRTRESPALRNNIGCLVIASKRGSFLEELKTKVVLLIRFIYERPSRKASCG
jgi:hypothetical protein